MNCLFKFICCGSVDDGKSTLIGRLLIDSGNVKKDQLEDALKASKRNGSDILEPAMLLDGLMAEREQQITIDIAHRYFDYHDIRFHILDCPGHKQYTQNMAIAAAQADTAVVVIDATKGISDQTRRHIEICSDFRIKRMCVCLTKCDLLKDQVSVELQHREICDFLKKFTFDYTLIPISALTGYNVNMVWDTLLRYAKETDQEKKKNKTQVLHVRTSHMYQGKRYYYTHPLTHVDCKKGDLLYVYPSQQALTVSETPKTYGCLCINQKIDITAGDCLTNHVPIVANHIFHKTIWFKHTDSPLLIKHGTRVANIIAINDEKLETDKELIFHNIDDVKENGFGILIDQTTKETVGCCLFIGNTHDVKKKIPLIRNTVSLNRKELLNFVLSNNKTPDERLNMLIRLLKDQGIELKLSENQE